jgi:hypothetical protein
MLGVVLRGGAFRAVPFRDYAELEKQQVLRLRSASLRMTNFLIALRMTNFLIALRVTNFLIALRMTSVRDGAMP